jgi:hypothetical protein
VEKECHKVWEEEHDRGYVLYYIGIRDTLNNKWMVHNHIFGSLSFLLTFDSSKKYFYHC